MDEWMLNDLLECSVCLERLDTSSKVLPCQHTFCKKCLDEIVSTHKELRCPECRILVDSTVDGLPPNVLLMRILEGMKNAGNPVPKKKASSFQKPPLVQVSPQQGSTNQPYNSTENNKIQPQNISQNSSQKQNVNPYAQAIYDYISKEVGDLSFKKGDIILLHKKVDTQWYQGECGGKTGIFPCSYVQVIKPLPNQVATCKALYDFRMVNNEDEGCLSFHKDDVITVIRRVDENWAEGRLNDHIGIFPLAFVEMNNVAQALMKLSISQPGPSRVAPPTPTNEESTPLIPCDQSGVVSNHVSVSHNNATVIHQNTANKSPAATPVSVSGVDATISSSNSTTSSSSITPNSSSNTSSTSDSAPNSPPSNQETHNQNPFLPTTQPSRQMILQTSHITNSAHGVLPTSHIIGQQYVMGSESFGKPHSYFGPTQAMEFSNFSQHPVEKRHSFSFVPAGHHNCSNSNKHTTEMTGSESAPDNQNGQLIRHGSQRHRRSGSDLTTAVNLPAGYVALYPYKPQKADELELKKGGVYFVTERCQDGWFKGTSSKTQKSGVFPGNYVTPAKPLTAVQGQPRAATAKEPTTAPTSHKPVHQQKQAKMMQMYGRQLSPPELPPRVSSPSSRLTRISVQNSSTSWSYPNEFPNSQKNSEGGTSTSPQAGPTTTATMIPDARTSASAAASPVLSPSVSTPSKSADKVKDKKEKSLIKRWTTIKRSKSPPASSSYSMDNPVFDDAPVGSAQTQSHPPPVHSRSCSCPTQLIQLRAENGSYHRTISASIPARLKHRERPSVSNANFTHSTSRPSEGTTFPKSFTSVGPSHRKSSSLDAGDATRKPRQLIPPVRERFRCIVPYPPNSEYELELRVGDIIYVHKKRGDGWYKGTQQRTGRTGLFPASFVETC